MIDSYNRSNSHQLEAEQTSCDSAEKRDRLGNGNPCHVLKLGVLDEPDAGKEGCHTGRIRSHHCDKPVYTLIYVFASLLLLFPSAQARAIQIRSNIRAETMGAPQSRLLTIKDKIKHSTLHARLGWNSVSLPLSKHMCELS